MNKKTDKIIWKEFKNNNEDALSFIYHQNIDFLFSYGKKFTAEEDLLLDIIQDLFFYLIRKRKTLGDTDNIRMYLLKAFRRRLFEELKKRDKQLQIARDYSFDFQDVSSIEEKMIFDEEESGKKLELRRGMEKLSARQQEVLYYKYTCGFDYKKISKIMSIPNDTVRKMVSRSMNSLKNYLKFKGLVLML